MIMRLKMSFECFILIWFSWFPIGGQSRFACLFPFRSFELISQGKHPETGGVSLKTPPLPPLKVLGDCRVNFTLKDKFPEVLCQFKNLSHLLSLSVVH